jgi:hypothetical protein
VYNFSLKKKKINKLRNAKDIETNKANGYESELLGRTGGRQ